MASTDRSEHPLRRAAGWLQATRAELVGLTVLLAGALVASGLLWLQATGRPPGLGDAMGFGEVVPPGPALVGTEVHDPTGETADLAASAALAPGVAAPGVAAPGALAPGQVSPGAPASVGPTTSVTVHVTGAVTIPGVVTLPAGARVAEAVVAAGGAQPDAGLERLNLARVLTDGEHVHLPRQGEADPVPAPGSESAGSGGIAADGRLDLNRATAADLETLPGIGPSRAAAIVEHRERHGPFTAPGDLRDVPGIGEATFQRLAERVVVG